MKNMFEGIKKEYRSAYAIGFIKSVAEMALNSDDTEEFKNGLKKIINVYELLNEQNKKG